MPTSLLQRSVLYVTGKGGVGKTTVAAGLGLLAARRGLRTIVCEVAEQDRVSGGLVGAEEEVRLAENLWATTIDPTSALEDWFARQLGSQTLVRTLSKSQAFQYFVAAAPGIRELITVGKVYDLSQGAGGAADARPYDLVVVDAPASGHGLAMLRTPRTFGEIARVGPVRRQAGKIGALLGDRDRTGYLAVALAEETPVNETLELERGIRDAVGVPLETVIVNRLTPQRYSEDEARAMRLAASDGHDAAAMAALRAALAEHGHASEQRRHLMRLTAGSSAGIVELPAIGDARLEAATYERVAELLEPAFGG